MHCNKLDYGFTILRCLQSYVLHSADLLIAHCSGEWLKIYILICAVFHVYNLSF